MVPWWVILMSFYMGMMTAWCITGLFGMNKK